MTRAGAVLFMSAMSFLTAHCFLPTPAQLLLPGTPTAAAFLSTTTTTTGVKAAAKAKADAAASRLAMADTADVCRGDAPSPGWVRLAQRNLARVRVGDALPDACVRRLDEDGNIEKLSIRELFGKKKGVLVGVPGAFTPTCSKMHLPEFVDKSGVLASKGAELIVFISVNDPYVTRAWEESQKAEGKVLMLSDGNGDLSAALGMLVDLSAQGMGPRCKRFVCVVEDGVVTHTKVGDKVELVSANAVERVLDEPKPSRKRRLFDKLLGKEESGDLLPA